MPGGDPMRHKGHMQDLPQWTETVAVGVTLGEKPFATPLQGQEL